MWIQWEANAAILLGELVKTVNHILCAWGTKMMLIWQLSSRRFWKITDRQQYSVVVTRLKYLKNHTSFTYNTHSIRLLHSEDREAYNPAMSFPNDLHHHVTPWQSHPELSRSEPYHARNFSDRVRAWSNHAWVSTLWEIHHVFQTGWFMSFLPYCRPEWLHHHLLSFLSHTLSARKPGSDKLWQATHWALV